MKNNDCLAEKENAPMPKSNVVKTPCFDSCCKDIEFIQKFLQIANEKQLHIILKNIERIFLYGA